MVTRSWSYLKLLGCLAFTMWHEGWKDCPGLPVSGPPVSIPLGRPPTSTSLPPSAPLGTRTNQLARHLRSHIHSPPFEASELEPRMLPIPKFQSGSEPKSDHISSEHMPSLIPEQESEHCVKEHVRRVCQYPSFFQIASQNGITRSKVSCCEML